METENKVLAIIWDYDGTIADTREKNLNVTRSIVRKISGKDPLSFDAVSSLEKYLAAQNRAENWRDFNADSFGFNSEQVDRAGDMWTAEQLADKTDVKIINGVDEVVRSLKRFPQGIVSQNSKSNIISTLKKNNLNNFFGEIIGYEEVDYDNQKPRPKGLLLCIEKLVNLKSGYIFYIGDHETDIQIARNTDQFFKDRGIDKRIISIGAAYFDYFNLDEYETKFDYLANKAKDVKIIINQFKE